MEQAILQLKALSGRIILNDWKGIWKLLKLVDETITPRANWDCVRRNFIKNYNLYLEIDENGLFTCRDAVEEDLDNLPTPEDILQTFKRHGAWLSEWSEYELSHSAQETIDHIVDFLYTDELEHKEKCKAVVKKYGLEDAN